MLNRTVIASVAIACVTVIICFYLYASSNRYVTVNASDGKVYKVDRRTGESFLLRRYGEIPLTPRAESRVKTAEERAIDLAKMARTLVPESLFLDNDYYIRKWVSRQKGELRIIGWKARRVDDQTFVVTYSIDQGSGSRSWAFEVEIEAGLVRNITGDPALEKKYGFSSQ